MAVRAWLGANEMTQHQTLDTQILQLIVAMFNAAPGADVLAELRSALTGGESVEALTRNLVRTDVFRSLYPDSLDTVEFSAKFALSVLGSEVGPSQLASAIGEIAALQRLGLDRAQTMLRAIDALLTVAPTSAEWGKARQAFENKVKVAAYYSIERLKSAQTLEELQKVVEPVNSSPCSVEAAIRQIDGLPSSHVILVVLPDLQTDTGVTNTLKHGGLTRDNTVGISGTVSDPDNVTAVEVLDGAIVLGRTSVSEDGTWQFTTAALANGEHALTVRTLGSACAAVTSSPIVFWVDATAPVYLASANVAENFPTNATAYTPTARDNVAVTDYALDTSVADNARFSLDTTTGALRFIANPDFESPGSAAGSNSYTVKITASDAAGNSAGQTVTINVTDVDEFDVSVPADANTATDGISENVAVGTAVGITLRASDDDATRNVVSYTFTDGGNPDGLFAIDSSSGVITTAKAIDRETHGATRSITVLATSEDGSTNAASFTIAIHNDATETRTLSVDLLNGGGTVSRVENTPSASDTAVVARLRATGEAATFAPGVLSWHLVSVNGSPATDAARFTLDPDGTLRFNAANYEEAFLHGRRQEGTEDVDNDYTVAVVLRDIDGNASTQTVVRVQVQDNDDETLPGTQTIDATDVRTAVDEHTGSGAATPVAVAQLTFANAIGLAHWSLPTTATAAGFSVSDTGSVVFTPPNREAAEFDGRDRNNPDDWLFSALVTGIDDDGNVEERTVSVRLDNVVEGTGLRFNEADNPVAVAESTDVPAVPVKVLSVQGAIGTVTWVLSGADKDRFQLGADGISLNLATSDFEAGWNDGTRGAGHDDDDNTYSVSVTAIDREGQQITRALDVNVTDVVETPTGTGVAGLVHATTVGSDRNATVTANIAESTAPTLLGTPVFTGAIGAVTWRVLGQSDGRANDFDEEDMVFDAEGRVYLNALDFENPAGRAGSNAYQLGLLGLDSDGNERQVVWNITVVDRPMAIAITTADASVPLTTTTQANGNLRSSVSVLERVGSDTSAYVFNAQLDTAARFDSPAGTALVWTVDSTYKDHALFTWNDTNKTLTLAAKDREDSRSSEGTSVYSVRLVATDRRDGTALQVAQHELAVTIDDVLESRNLVIGADIDNVVYSFAEGEDAVVGVFSLANTSDLPVGKVTWTVESDNRWMYYVEELPGNTFRVSMPGLDRAELGGSHSFTVHATDAQGNTDTELVNVELRSAPFQLTNPTVVEIQEGVATSLALRVDTLPGTGVTWSVLSSADDLNKLLLTQPNADGVAELKVQDYESLVTNVEGHRGYQVTLVATSADLDYIARKVIEVRVTDAPIVIAPSKGTPDPGNPAVQVLQIAENVDTSSNDAIVTTLALRALATDDTLTGTLRWRLEGSDTARFELNQATGHLRLKTQNFEHEDPANPDPAADDTYEVTLVAEDMAADGTTVLQSARQAFRVEVQNLDEDDRFFLITLGPDDWSSTDPYNRDETEAIVVQLGTFGDAPNGAITWLVTLTNGGTALPGEAFTVSNNVLTIHPLDWEAYGSIDDGRIVVSIDGRDEEGTLSGGGFSGAVGFTLRTVDVNEPRTLTLQRLPTGPLLWNENDTTVSWVPEGVLATLPNGARPSLPATPYSFSKVDSGSAGSFGADHARFAVNAGTGAVTLLAPLDRESPVDADADNTYHVTLRVQDQDGNSATHTLAVQIAGVDEPATLQIQRGGVALADAAPITLSENDFFTTTLTAVASPTTPARGALHWSLVGEIPEGLEINPSTGVLSWTGANHEATTGGMVTATVRVTDSDIGPGGFSPNEATETITFQIADRATEVQVAGGYRQVLAERTDFQVAVSLVDDGSSTPRADVVWSLAGEDANDFVFDGSTLRWNTAGNGGLPDHETPKDGPTSTGGDNVYQATLVATQAGTSVELARQFFQLSVSNLTLAASITADEYSVGIAFNTEATRSVATLSSIFISNPEEGGAAELQWDMARMTAAGWQLDGDPNIRRIEGTNTYSSFTFVPAEAGSTTGGVITYYVNPAYAATPGYRALASGQGPTTDPVTLALVGGTSLVRGFVIEGVEDLPEISARPGGGTASGVVATLAEDPGVRLELTAEMLVNLTGASDPDRGDTVNVFVVTDVNASFGTLLIGKSLAEATPWRAATATDPGNCQIGRTEAGDNYYLGYWLPAENATGSVTAMRVHALETSFPQIYSFDDPNTVASALAALNKRSVNGFDVQVSVTAVNDAPRLSFFESEVAVEAGQSVRVSEDLVWSDPDNPTPAALTVAFINGYRPGVDSLSVAEEDLEDTGLQAVWDDDEGTLVISAQTGQTPAELAWGNVLEAIQYTHAATTDTRTTLELQFTLQDPGGLTDTAGLTLAFAAPAAPAPVPTSTGQGSLQSVMAAPLVQLAGVAPVLAFGDLSV